MTLHNQSSELDEMQELLQNSESVENESILAPFLPTREQSADSLPANEENSEENVFPDVMFEEDNGVGQIGDSDVDDDHITMPPGFSKHDNNAANDEDDKAGTEKIASQCGKDIGTALANIVSIPTPFGVLPYLELTVNGAINKYVLYKNMEFVEGNKKKKFFKLDPNPTPLLYGWKHYAAMYNAHDRRGWVGYCGLVPENSAVPHLATHVLIEIWETRCDDPRVDIILYDNLLKSVEYIQWGLTWLRQNNPSSDPLASFDRQMIEG